MIISLRQLFLFTLVELLVFTSRLDGYQDLFFAHKTFQGQWKQLQVQKQLGSCQPCQYLIKIKDDKIHFYIANQNALFQYEIAFQEPDEGLLFERNYTLSTTSQNNPKVNSIDMKFKISAEDGIRYSFIIALPELGVYLQHTQKRYTYILGFISALYSAIYVIMFPLSKQFLELNLKKMTDRTNLGIMVFYSMTTVFICCYNLILVSIYLWYYTNFIGKLVFYGIFGMSFLLSIIQFTYSFAAIQNNINSKLWQDNKCKLCVLLSIGILLILSPLILAYFPKGIWFHGFFVICVMLQGIQAYYKLRFVYWRFILIFCINIAYLALISDLYPVINFRSISIFSYLTLLQILLIGVGIMYILLNRKLKNASIQQLQQSNKKTAWQSKQKNKGTQQTQKYVIMSQQTIKTQYEMKNSK